MSAGQRFGFIPTATFEKICDTAFADMKQISADNGMPVPCNNKGQPLAATAVLQPLSAASTMAVFRKRKEFQDSQGNYDLRAVVLPRAQDRKGIQGQLFQEVVESWGKCDYKIPGRERYVKRAFVAPSGEIMEMEHQVSRIDANGHLQPLPASLEKYLNHPSTAMDVEQFVSSMAHATKHGVVPTWESDVNVQAPGSTSDSIPSLENAPETTRYKNLQELLSDTMRAEAPSPDGKILFMVNSAGEGWAHGVGGQFDVAFSTPTWAKSTTISIPKT